jgi:hypothetical protein
MKNLKLLGISVTLLCVMSMTAFAGDTTSPPCAPGDTTSPPCAMSQVVPDDAVILGQTDTPPASDSAAAYSVAREVVVDLALLLF